MDRKQEEGAQMELERLAEARLQTAFSGMLNALDFFIGSGMPLKDFKRE